MLTKDQRIIVIESFLVARNAMVRRNENVLFEKSDNVGQWCICELTRETDTLDQDFTIEALELFELGSTDQVLLRSMYVDRIEEDIMGVTSELKISAAQLTKAPVAEIVDFCLTAPRNGNINMLLGNNL